MAGRVPLRPRQRPAGEPGAPAQRGTAVRHRAPHPARTRTRPVRPARGRTPDAHPRAPAAGEAARPAHPGAVLVGPAGRGPGGLPGRPADPRRGTGPGARPGAPRPGVGDPGRRPAPPAGPGPDRPPATAAAAARERGRTRVHDEPARSGGPGRRRAKNRPSPPRGTPPPRSPSPSRSPPRPGGRAPGHRPAPAPRRRGRLRVGRGPDRRPGTGADRGPDRTTVGLAAITGKPGTGKSTLAVHVAHTLAETGFPDGQLYCDLRGTTGTPATPAEVLGRFLRALGIPGQLIPESLDERAEMYRTRLASRRVLVVLDDAAGEGQVLPLLPGSRGCAVLVTGRARSPRSPAPTGSNWTSSTRTWPSNSWPGSSAGNGSRGGPGGRGPGPHGRTAPARPADRGRPARRAPPLDPRVHGAAPRQRTAPARRADARRADDAGQPVPHVRRPRTGRPPAAAPPQHGPGADPPELVGGRPARRPPPLPLRPHGTARRRADAGRRRGRAHRRLPVPLPRDHPGVRAGATGGPPPAGGAAGGARPDGGRLDAPDPAGPPHGVRGDFTVLHGDAPRWEPPASYTEEVLADPLAWLDAEQTALCRMVEHAADEGLHDLSWDLATSLVTLFEVRGHYDLWEQTHLRALAAVRKAGNLRAPPPCARRSARST